jgi:hypothetical protein
MADDRIRRDQDDVDVDVDGSLSENNGSVAEVPGGAADEEDRLVEEDD